MEEGLWKYVQSNGSQSYKLTFEEIDCIFDIEADFQKTLVKCRQVTIDTVHHEKLMVKLLGHLMTAFVPLMKDRKLVK